MRNQGWVVLQPHTIATVLRVPMSKWIRWHLIYTQAPMLQAIQGDVAQWNVFNVAALNVTQELLLLNEKTTSAGCSS